jgi:hypothetical protein
MSGAAHPGCDDWPEPRGSPGPRVASFRVPQRIAASLSIRGASAVVRHHSSRSAADISWSIATVRAELYPQEDMTWCRQAREDRRGEGPDRAMTRHREASLRMAARRRSVMIRGVIVAGLVCVVNTSQASAMTISMVERMMHQPFPQSDASQAQQPPRKIEWRHPALAWQEPRGVIAAPSPTVYGQLVHYCAMGHGAERW